MESVHLDDLVLLNCAFQKDFVSRLAQETVNRRFMAAMRSANKQSKISLTIRHEDLTSSLIGQFYIIIQSGAKCVDWNIRVNDNVSEQYLHREHLRNILSNESGTREANNDHPANCIYEISRTLFAIFSRFKHFSRITFLPCSEWVRLSIGIMLNIFRTENFQPISVKELAYSTGGHGGMFKNSSFKIDERDCELIQVLSPSLEKYILLVGELPQERSELSKSFWTAMSNCYELKKLFLARTGYMPQLNLNSDVSNCLKSLNIREFHAFEDIPANDQWLIESFKQNTKLRKLNINDTDQIKVLSNRAILSIVAQLLSVEIVLYSYNEDDIIKAMPNIRQIIQALPENGYLNVEHLIVFLQETASVAEKDAVIMRALSFWIRLSNETKKRIRLYAREFRFSATWIAVAVSQHAIEDLSKQEEFSGIRIKYHHDGSRTNLRFSDARITLYNQLLAFKPYLTAEYVGTGHLP